MLERCIVIVGNIVHEEVDAIVNAANRELIAGGEVDGAIHRPAGRELVEAKRLLGGCEHGKAKHTESYGLKAPLIIHTVAPKFHPIFKYEEDKEALLASCYVESLSLAKELRLQSISFPALGTGVYGWSHELSSPISMKAIADWLKSSKYDISIRFVVISEEIAIIYRNEWENIVQLSK